MKLKKIISILICSVFATMYLFSVTAFAWETPSLDLNISYNEKKGKITVEYIVHDAAGLESADFRLKFNSDALKLDDYTTTDITDTFVEVGIMADDESKVAIQFIDLYYVKEADCDDDGSFVAATLTFKITDKSVTEFVFIATADSCAMDPDSERVSPARYTQKLSLTDAENESEADTSLSSNADIKKIIIIAVITLLVFVGGTAAFVIKCRKSDN